MLPQALCACVTPVHCIPPAGDLTDWPFGQRMQNYPPNPEPSPKLVASFGTTTQIYASAQMSFQNPEPKWMPPELVVLH